MTLTKVLRAQVTIRLADLFLGNALDQGGEELEEGELIEGEGEGEDTELEPRSNELERVEASETVGDASESVHAIKARALELVSLIVSKEKRRKKKSAVGEYGTY